MKRVKVFDKDTGKQVGFLDASGVTEDTRRAYDYKCRYDACNCTMHWRKAVDRKANTQPDPAIFVKNPSSHHKEKCPGDLVRIQRENSEYTTLIDDVIHVRVNFPMGFAPVDRKPLAGYLSAELRQAAEKDKKIQPFGSLDALAKFFEKTFGGIESEAAAEVQVHYQGRSAPWGKLFKGSDRYEKLYERSQFHLHQDEGKDTPPIVTVVRPVKEIARNRTGKRRFECERQEVVVQFPGHNDGKTMPRLQRVVPVIVCGDPQAAADMERRMLAGESTLVAARPFHAGPQSPPVRYGELRISLTISKAEQLASVDSKYWHPTYEEVSQRTIFGSVDTIKISRVPHHR